jgi:uncharacterized protein (TIGR00369 family)
MRSENPEYRRKLFFHPRCKFKKEMRTSAKRAQAAVTVAEAAAGDDAAAGVVKMRMPLLPHMRRDAAVAQFHGGPVASLIDTAGDFAVALAVGGGVPTINFRVDYLRPSSGGHLLAVATARRVGRTVGVADVDVFDEQGRLTAIGRATYSAQVG